MLGSLKVKVLYPTVSVRRAGNSPQSLYPSKAWSVNPAIVHRRRPKLASGDLSCVPDSGLSKPQGKLTAGQKSAEGVVVKIACESRKERRPERFPCQGVKGVVSKQRDS